MLNRKNILFQAIENGFEETIEGYPIETKYSKEKDAIDYTVYGNTVYGENLFNYTEPYNDNQIIADEDGWFDVTIDNTEGTSTTFKWCYTAVNNALKPNTEYIIFTEIAECTGSITVQALSQYSDNKSQFTNTPVRYNTAGTRTTTITTLSSFDDCKTMLRSHCYCGKGRSGHAKFRIAVYETQKDEFLPYSKQSVGDKTENLFNYTEPYDDNQIIADENGWFDVTIDNTEGTTTKYVKFFTKPNLQLKPSKLYYAKQILETKTGNIRCDWVSNNTNDLSQFSSNLVNGSGYVVTRSDFTNCKYMMRGNVGCTAGNTGRVKFRLMVYEASEDLYNRTEPYNEKCIIPDENGWYDVTIDNTDGTTSKTALCFTAVNQKLKPNTKYYIYAEIAERSGAINLVLADANNTSSYKSQFATSVTTQSNYATTRANFSDCETMLRNHCYCAAGASGHIKFRISVYEVIQKSFEPYDKYKIPITVTGKNLFDISKSDGFTSQYTGLTSTITDNVITVSSTINRIGYLKLGTFEEGTYYIGMTSEDYTGYSIIFINGVSSQKQVNNVITISKRSVIEIMVNVYSGHTFHFTNIQITKSDVTTSYEPYHEPITTNIYRDAQLGQGESINYKSDNLPTIKLVNDTNKLTTDTEVKPSKISLTYTTKVRGSNE